MNSVETLQTTLNTAGCAYAACKAYKAGECTSPKRRRAECIPFALDVLGLDPSKMKDGRLKASTAKLCRRSYTCEVWHCLCNLNDYCTVEPAKADCTEHALAILGVGEGADESKSG